MSRERFIDPGIWSSEQFCDVCLSARLLFIGCITHADDCGFLPASAHGLKVKIFPSDNDIDRDRVETWLSELLRVGLVKRYEDPHNVLWIPRFFKWQPLKWRSKSKHLVALVEAGLFSQELDQRGRVARISQVRAGPGRISQAEPVSDPKPTEPGRISQADPKPGSAGRNQAEFTEGRGVVSSRVESCRGESRDIQTPPLTSDVSVTGPTPPAFAPGAIPDLPGQEALPFDPPVFPLEATAGRETEASPTTSPPATVTATTPSKSGFAPMGADGNVNTGGEISEPTADDKITDLTSGIVKLWDDEIDFAQEKTLRFFMVQHDKANPVHLLSHVREVDQSKKIKHKRRALYDRLRGKVVLEPSDASKKWAAEKLNGGAAKTKGQPTAIGESLPASEPKKGRAKEAHPDLANMFESMTSFWPNTKSEDKAREIAGTMLAIQPAFVLAHCYAINVEKNPREPWKDLRGRLGAAEKPGDDFMKKAKIDVEVMTGAPA